MNVAFNCLSEEFKTPFGCVRENQPCHLTVKVPEYYAVTGVDVILTTDTPYGMRVSFELTGTQDGYQIYQTQFSLSRRGLYFYHFRCQGSQGPFHVYRCGETDTSINQGDLWQLTCYPVDFHPPLDYAGAVMYQIFPDRFHRCGSCDLTEKLQPYWIHENWSDTPHFLPNEHGEVLNNDFFGGNFQGIRAKLAYLKELSVDVIYLNPISMAFSNHRYDTADYLRPDPMLGTEEEFAALCRDAHKLGMKVILDGVFSHTGSNSVYFDKNHVFGHGAISDPNSPYRSWFDFQEYPNRYTSWWGIDTLPCVNEMDPAFLEHIITGTDSVIAHWLNLGADGFRLDVADELPDSFIALFRKRLKELNPEALLLGEVWEDASNKISYGARRKYFSDGELDSVMNYPFRSAILSFMAHPDANSFRAAVMSVAEHYPQEVLHCLMNSLSTHDTPRILTLLGDSFEGSKQEKAHRFLEGDAKLWAIRRECAAAVLQFTLPGMPCIYYGDEAGLEGFEDPFNRRCFPWGHELKELQEVYRVLSKLKGSYPALKRGGIHFQDSGVGVIHMVRTCDTQHIHIFVNGSTDPVTIPITGQLLFQSHANKEKRLLHLESWGAAVMIE